MEDGDDESLAVEAGPGAATGVCPGELPPCCCPDALPCVHAAKGLGCIGLWGTCRVRPVGAAEQYVPAPVHAWA